MKINTINTSTCLNNQQQNKSVTFGNIGSIGSKALKALEFDKSNFSTAGLCTVCYLAVFAPRYIKSRDDSERREILVRDLPTITTIIFGRRILQNIVSQIYTKTTGLALHIKPEKHETPLQKIFNYLRPDKGIKVLSSSEITEKYSNVHLNKNGLADFADFITQQGGNIKKVLSSNKELKTHLQTAYQQFNPDGNFEKAGPAEIADMLRKINKKNAPKNSEIQAIENILKTPDNILVRRAKRINSTFDFLATLVFIPLILGLLLPRINECITKSHYKKQKDKVDKTKSGQ